MKNKENLSQKEARCWHCCNLLRSFTTSQPLFDLKKATAFPVTASHTMIELIPYYYVVEFWLELKVEAPLISFCNVYLEQRDYIATVNFIFNIKFKYKIFSNLLLRCIHVFHLMVSRYNR